MTTVVMFMLLRLAPRQQSDDKKTKKPGLGPGLSSKLQNQDFWWLRMDLFGEVGVGLHAVFANVEAFNLFLFCDPNATEDGSNHLPGYQGSDDRENRVNNHAE